MGCVGRYIQSAVPPMKIQTSISLLVSIAIAFASIAMSQQPSLAENVTFYCGKSRGSPATFARARDGSKLPIIHWVSNFGLSQGLTPEKRCAEVSRRFQISYDRGTLKYIKLGSIRGIPVICADLQQNSPCSEQSLLFTLSPESNPEETFRRLLDRRALAAGNALQQSSNKQLFVDINKYFQRFEK